VPHPPAFCLAFSPDGNQLAAAYDSSSKGSSLAVFEVKTGKLVRQMGNFHPSVSYVRFSADGKKLHASESLGPVSLWDAASGKRLRLWKAPPAVPAEEHKRGQTAKQGMLSPDGKVIVWQMHHFKDRKIGESPHPFNTNGLRFQDAATGKLLYEKKFGPSLDSFAFSPDGRRYAANCGKLVIWETATGKELLALKQPMYRAALTPDWRHAVTVEGNSRVRLWDLKTKKLVHELYPGLHHLNSHLLETPQVFSADGKMLVLATTSTLRLFDTVTGKERAVPGHRAPFKPRFSADGRTLFTSCNERRFSWDLSSAEDPALLSNQLKKPWEGICGELALAHSADGRLFIDSHFESYARVREAATGRVLRTLDHGRLSVCFGLFSPDAAHALLECYPLEKGTVGPDAFWLFDVKTGKKTGEIKTEYDVGRPVFSADGRFIARADHRNAAYVHDAVTGKIVRTLRSSRPLAKTECDDVDLLFSPDGQYLAVATYLGLSAFTLEEDAKHTYPLRIFHVASGREIGRFPINPKQGSKAAHLSCSAWSPDGRILAIAEQNSPTINLIEVASGKVRAQFLGHRHGVHALAFSPDGKIMASGGIDNVGFLWDVTGARTEAPAKKASEQELALWWMDLADPDAKRAGVAAARLIRVSDQSVTFLKKRLHPTRATDARRLAQLLADLDARSFKTRRAASLALGQLGEMAEPALRRALQQRPALEVVRRIEAILDHIERGPLPPEKLRALRAVEVLEHVDTPAARRCLARLMKGAPEARQTREAAASWARLAKHR
jgi:WD40 repeat protein